jgi:hypothetical protein
MVGLVARWVAVGYDQRWIVSVAGVLTVESSIRRGGSGSYLGEAYSVGDIAWHCDCEAPKE